VETRLHRIVKSEPMTPASTNSLKSGISAPPISVEVELYKLAVEMGDRISADGRSPAPSNR